MDFQKQYPAPKSSHFSLSKACELFWKEVIKHFHLSLISSKAHLHCHWQRLQATAIKIYCVTKERLTGLNHWGYFIFIDSFNSVQDDFDLHLFLFVHPGQLPVGVARQVFFSL